MFSFVIFTVLEKTKHWIDLFTVRLGQVRCLCHPVTGSLKDFCLHGRKNSLSNVDGVLCTFGKRKWQLKMCAELAFYYLWFNSVQQ